MLAGQESIVGVELDGLFERFIRHSRKLRRPHRTLLLHEVGIAGELPDAPVDRDSSLCTVSERNRDLVEIGNFERLTPMYDRQS